MDAGIQKKILDLLGKHRIMTLATLRPDGWPQATTVGYVHDGLTLYFLCDPESQKAHNISHDNRVSLTIDHDTDDMKAIAGLSMAAHAEAVTESPEARKVIELLTKNYPEQKDLPFEIPGPEDVKIFKLMPTVISVLDYSKGFGHTDLVTY